MYKKNYNKYLKATQLEKKINYLNENNITQMIKRKLSGIYRYEQANITITPTLKSYNQ